MKQLMYNEDVVNLTILDSQTYNVNVKDVKQMHITLASMQTSLLVLDIESETIEVKVVVEEQAKLNILYRYRQKCHLNEEASIKKDAQLIVGHYQLHTNLMENILRYDLMESGASVEVITSVVTSGVNHFNIECIHHVGHTTSKMENYAIVHENGNYGMQANGRILKGAKESASHQATRVLTSSDKQKSEVTPLLFIDENDVQASHAATLGQMNEDHLYYLQTRGLSKDEALALLTLSYVYPILRVVEEVEEVKQVIESEIEKKVGLAC